MAFSPIGVGLGAGLRATGVHAAKHTAKQVSLTMLAGNRNGIFLQEGITGAWVTKR
jgi:hypothetical protein